MILMYIVLIYIFLLTLFAGLAVFVSLEDVFVTLFVAGAASFASSGKIGNPPSSMN